MSMTKINHQQHVEPLSASPGQAERRVWIAPKITCVRAGDAEAGPNPVRPEGAFAQGS